ncbi:MAG: methyltransferase domain-containing protein [Mesorhizobium sp.]|nr:MAG: methyltransferase domain-containing protein [Mesorhizobium sp.]
MTLPSYAMNQASFPQMYERWLVGPLFRPWAEMALGELELSSGDRLLDIACGTGIVARVARERLGEAGYIVGVDISPDMLAVARAVVPAIDWRQGNAGELPLTVRRSTWSSASKDCSSFLTGPRRRRRCVARWRRVAGWRSPRGARTTKSRSFSNCAASRSAIWEPSPINGTASGKRLHLRRCCETPASARSDQGLFRAPSISRKAHLSCI